MAYHRTESSEKKREKRHAKIVSVAQKLFASKGVAGTTVQDIVSAAGTSIGNFYFYFENKEELINEIVGGSLQDAYQMAESLMPKVPAGPARLAVIVFCNAKVLVGHDSKVLPILRQTGANIVAEYVMTRNAEFLQGHLRSNFPDIAEDQYTLISEAWTGVGRAAIVSVISKAELTSSESEKMVVFMLRYNLRALRVPDAEIESAIAAARDIVPAL